MVSFIFLRYPVQNSGITSRVVFDTEEEITNLMTKASSEMRDLGGPSEKLTLSFYRNEVDHYPL
ncbi:MAG: hypothetical protein SWC96_02180 [Thermodesulfobacteriota bacterium]|nr:hypothetical protein [Thermodesulfobacteriota bacterium]